MGGGTNLGQMYLLGGLTQGMAPHIEKYQETKRKEQEKARETDIMFKGQLFDQGMKVLLPYLSTPEGKSIVGGLFGQAAEKPAFTKISDIQDWNNQMLQQQGEAIKKLPGGDPTAQRKFALFKAEEEERQKNRLALVGARSKSLIDSIKGDFSLTDAMKLKDSVDKGTFDPQDPNRQAASNLLNAVRKYGTRTKNGQFQGIVTLLKQARAQGYPAKKNRELVTGALAQYGLEDEISNYEEYFR